jgi:glucose/arabinose dehydrogenase
LAFFYKKYNYTMLQNTLRWLLLLLPLSAWAQPKIQLEQFSTGFNRPVDITHCGDSRLFVVEQRGYIWILDSLGNKLPTPFLNIDSLVNSNGNEQGLLGLAFHPNYTQNGFFYVNYIRNNSDTRVARYSVSGDPNVANAASAKTLLDVDQPYSNHNGGCLKFGADSMLYISLGDGGSGGDPQNYSQTKNTYLGKMLRVDVNNPVAPYYTVPPDNPFVGDAAYFPEIWSLGLRNVWRFSFDRLTGDMWMGEVGQSAREEINFEAAGDAGHNYGWRCYEGNNPYNTAGCQPASSYTAPAYAYNHSTANGCSVTGGFIYRGSKYPDLYGQYIFADYCSGRWWNTKRETNGTFTTQVLANLTPYEYTTFGEDRLGELYVGALSSGKIFKIKELCSAFQIEGTVTNATCDGAGNGSVVLNVTGATGNVTYTWSAGGGGSSLLNLNPGTYIVAAQDGNQCIRRDTFVVGAATVDVPTVLATSEVLCANQTVLLTAQGTPPAGFDYQWYLNGQAISGATDNTYNATDAGSYSVQYLNPNCGLGQSETVVVNALGAPTISFLAGQPIMCQGDTAILQAMAAPAGFGYQWANSAGEIPGATTQTLAVTEFDEYRVRWESPTCTGQYIGQQTVDYEITLLPSISFVNGVLQADNLVPPVQWYLNGTAIPGATDVTYTPTVSGFYEFIQITPNGCDFGTGLQVQVSGTQDPASVTRCHVTPNPTAGAFRLDLNLTSTQKYTLTLRDAAGRTLQSVTESGRTLARTFDLSAQPAGTYFLSVQLADGMLVREIVKQ